MVQFHIYVNVSVPKHIPVKGDERGKVSTSFRKEHTKHRLTV